MHALSTGSSKSMESTKDADCSDIISMSSVNPTLMSTKTTSPVQIPGATQVVSGYFKGLPEQHAVIRLASLVDRNVDLIGKHSVLKCELAISPKA